MVGLGIVSASVKKNRKLKMAEKWYYSKDGEEKGVTSYSALKDLVNSGDIQPTDLVRKEGGTKWQSVGRIKGLFSDSIRKNTPPPLPDNISVPPPKFFKYLMQHWKQTSGTWFLPVVLGIFLLPILSLSKPVVGWENLAALTIGLYILIATSAFLYFISQLFKYVWRRERELKPGGKSWLARFSHDITYFAIFLLTPLLGIEYFTKPSGLLVTAIPKLHQLQEDVFGTETLPLIFDKLKSERESSLTNSEFSMSNINVKELQSRAELALSQTREKTIDLLPLLSQYHLQDKLVKHFDSHIPEAEKTIQDFKTIPFRDRSKPHIFDLIREGNGILAKLDIQPNKEIVSDLKSAEQELKGAIASLPNLKGRLKDHEKELSGLRFLMKKEKDTLLSNQKINPQQKKVFIQRQESREKSVLSGPQNEISQTQKDIQSQKQNIQDLGQKISKLKSQIPDSVITNTKTYIRNINRAAVVLHRAGLPDERETYDSERRKQFAILSDSLTNLKYEMQKQLESYKPEVIVNKDLVTVSGMTHIVNGDQYYLDNRIIIIPSKCASIFITNRIDDNQVAIQGRFRFIRNSTDMNALGGSIDVEYFECDAVYSESLMQRIQFQKTIEPFFDPIRLPRSPDNISELIVVLKKLVGGEKISAALSEVDLEYEKIISSRDPSKQITLSLPITTASTVKKSTELDKVDENIRLNEKVLNKPRVAIPKKQHLKLFDTLIGKGSGGGEFKFKPKGNAVTSGSFTAWTVPKDPDLNEDYLIIIQVKLPDTYKSTPYSASDLKGIVLGTDNHRQTIPWDVRWPNTTFSPNAEGDIKPVEKGREGGYLTVKNRSAQLIVKIPGSQVPATRDTIKIQSRVLKEKCILEIEF